ncbi:MAG TPA: SurA N-terminal domain-containing protein [Candidatus Saccharimonadales bacterium]|nr:SurA N-terminal domain-containing protein [Candidatus Saccharimonadales bacterium]
MKKLIKRIQRKKEEAPTPTRITNDTVAEHRERILAGGRRFKYPVQYARHRLVFNTIVVSIVFIILLIAIGWWQLYPMQNSSAFMYRLTRIIPIPVAVVNSEQVPYSDYLVQYRGSEYYLNKYGEIKLDSSDGRRQLNYIKRQSLDKAEQTTYARQLARKLNIVVTNDDIDKFINEERNTANGRVSQETYDSSMQLYYGETPSDYRLRIANSMLEAKIAFAVDDSATAQVKQAQTLVTSTQGDLAAVATQMAKSKGGKVTAGQSGLIDVTSKFSGLRVSEVAKMAKGSISGPLKSTTDDGYYFVKIVDKTGTQVDFLYLHIPLTTFTDEFAGLGSSHKIQEYIKISDK